MEEALNLKELFFVLRKKLLLIIGITLLSGAVGALFTHYFINPQYNATTQILVNQLNSGQSTLYTTNAVQTNTELVNTYSVIIDDPSVLNQVIQNLNLNMTAGQLAGLLTVSPVQNSQVFSLTAKTGSPEQSVRIVNNVAQVFRMQVKNVMKVDNVSILSPATQASSSAKVAPNLKMNTAIALALGLMLSVGLAFLLDYLDDSIRTQKDVRRKLGLPVLGVISHMGRRQQQMERINSFSATPSHHHVNGGAEHAEAK
ncbi:YveK family protein [Sporolactobacillus pectinivorans]|uniref:YveK family protein n=1 Tax=Sporolactobacillus pectinivorans TaxID=1591408 RepID=UPI000C266B7E|nr:Wzz/FepE/Etk N-terminal domain-containing protein [Sporolactobacillus pectinivorans]